MQFDGIGVGPRGTEKLGCCTQMAVFYRKDMKTSSVQPIVRYRCKYFELRDLVAILYALRLQVSCGQSVNSPPLKPHSLFCFIYLVQQQKQTKFDVYKLEYFY